MRILRILVLTASIAGLARAQSIDVNRIGPQSGSIVSDFQLVDQQGRSRSLASLAGARGTMLVFVRSADWCPYGKTQLLELQRNLATVTKEGYGLAAVSYDPRETLRTFADRHGVTLPLLSDAGSKTIAAWGLLNRSATGKEAGVAHPGIVIIAPDRRVIDRAFEPTFQEHTTSASLLARIGAPVAPAAGAQSVAAPHLALRAGTTDAAAAPGERLTLLVDATPGPKIHVYSPEQKDYIPVALKLNGSAEFRSHPVKFPPSGTYFFAPLNETVKVYDKPFRVLQDVTLSLAPELQKRATGKESITITGTFQYQACDDAVCYRPETVPLTWRIALTPLVR